MTHGGKPLIAPSVRAHRRRFQPTEDDFAYVLSWQGVRRGPRTDGGLMPNSMSHVSLMCLLARAILLEPQSSSLGPSLIGLEAMAPDFARASTATASMALRRLHVSISMTAGLIWTL